MTRVDHVVVAIPARDEESLLPACLRSVSAAALVLPGHAPASGCRSRWPWTAAPTSRPSSPGRGESTSSHCRARGSGAARDAAVECGLAALGGPAESSTWIACTDADTVVPSHWLLRQLMWAERGADLVVGTAEPVGAARAETLAAWHARHRLVEGHEYVHGANLGVRADRWRQVGRFGHR